MPQAKLVGCICGVSTDEKAGAGAALSAAGWGPL